MGVREERLYADYRAIQRFRSRVMTYEVISTTDPPEAYRIYYNLKSLVGLDGGVPRFKTGHEIEIRYPSGYPRGKPIVRIVSTPPPLHPNIWRDRRVCIEDRWIPGIGIPLDGICELVGKIVAYQEYNLASAANRDSALAVWVQGNEHKLPLDNSQIRLPDVGDTIRWGEEVELPPLPPRIAFG
jgi:ubiquitin-protein ligase